jgi:hypothetical protein
MVFLLKVQGTVCQKSTWKLLYSSKLKVIKYDRDNMLTRKKLKTNGKVKLF